MGELDGKVAIVTGAGRLRGIGRAAAVALAALGADVAITGTGRDPATFPDDERAIGWRDVESVADQIREQGRRALPLTVDASNLEATQSMVDQTVEAFGRVDILINNAAFARGPDRVPLGELDPEIFRRVMDIKVTGTYFATNRSAQRRHHRHRVPRRRTTVLHHARARGEGVRSVAGGARVLGALAQTLASLLPEM